MITEDKKTALLWKVNSSLVIAENAAEAIKVYQKHFNAEVETLKTQNEVIL